MTKRHPNSKDTTHRRPANRPSVRPSPTIGRCQHASARRTGRALTARHCEERRHNKSMSGERTRMSILAPLGCDTSRCGVSSIGHRLLLRRQAVTGTAKTRRIDFRRTGPRYPLAANESQHVAPRHHADVDTTYQRPASEVTPTWTSDRPARTGVEKLCRTPTSV